MRFSRKRKGAQIFDTEIVNISETGMAFRVSVEHAPIIGETIKVEFNVPGERYKIAWFANVIWLETPYNRADRKRERVKAGIQFHEFPRRHKAILQQGLRARFNELMLEERRQKILTFFRSLPEAGLYLGVIALVAAFFYYFTQRTPTYDENRPTQWGERFFQKVIKDKPK
ncbi:MAG TPA: PilZ domain-containing protein [Bdellovibrionales bacterium]|nr:PilZ domain-containing protein [Bdellovibrionales bacterium]